MEQNTYSKFDPNNQKSMFGEGTSSDIAGKILDLVRNEPTHTHFDLIEEMIRRVQMNEYNRLKEGINNRETQIQNLIYERDEAIMECRKRKGIEQDMNHYREFADDLYKSVIALYGWLDSSGLRGKHPMIDADLESAVKLYRQYRKERFPDTIVLE